MKFALLLTFTTAWVIIYPLLAIFFWGYPSTFAAWQAIDFVTLALDVVIFLWVLRHVANRLGEV